MTTAQLPGGSQLTSALGFGCLTLSAGSSRRHSIRLVHAAYDAGIRHFDVAPPYGMGTAEETLGEALRDRRQHVTVATKVGTTRPRHSSGVILLRSLASPLRKLAPGLTRRVGATVYAGLIARGNFDVSFVETSVMESLSRLKIEYIDLLLLHEVAPDQVTNELLNLLENLRKKGLVRTLGTGTSYPNTMAIHEMHPHFFDVSQYSWSVLDADQEKPPGFTILHKTVRRALAPVREWLSQDTTRMRRLSDAAGIDLSAGNNLVDILLGTALANNPEGIVLVSSRQKSRVEANARLLSDASIVNAGRRFGAAFWAEPDRPEN
jgi:D-threo-aldose 1-dehydrogenase